MKIKTAIALRTIFGVTLLTNMSICFSDEPKWGTIKGQVRLVGDIPKVPPLIRGPIRVPDERLVVDPGSRGVANVAIYLMKKPENVHLSRQKNEADRIKLEIKDRRFDPHLAFVRTDQEIQVVSKDRSAAEFKISPIRNKPFHAVMPLNDQEGLLLGPSLSQRSIQRNQRGQVQIQYGPVPFECSPISYWYFITSLTILSAFLLLSKPRKSNQKIFSEPVQDEGEGAAT